ncbi:MAG: aldehyde dehydrogenase family protein [Bacteroidota bacterium]
MPFESRNPFTNELVKTYEFVNRDTITNTIIGLHQEFCTWKNISIDDRANYINRLAETLTIHKEVLATTVSLETAKPIRQSHLEIEKCISTCKYYAANVSTYLAPTIINEKATIHYQALGVIVGIMPWNFPIWQVIRFAVPTLLAGNTVLIKHAPSTPQSSLLLEKIFKETNSLHNIFKQEFIAIEDIEFLIAHPYIKGISLTGSTEAGRSVAQLAAKYLKKYVLELGGSDPFIICKDASLDALIQSAVDSRCRNNGQSCIAAKRFIVDELIIDLFKEKLINQLEKLIYAYPEDEEAYITSLARSDLKIKTEEQLNKLASLGFDLIYSYHAKSLSTSSIFPQVYQAQEERRFEMYTDELFAPIFLIYSFQSIDEAIQLANNTEYGLGASVWTSNNEWIKQISMELESGMVYVNEMTISEAKYPFGGIKNSGVGKELGLLGIKEFVNSKLVVIK